MRQNKPTCVSSQIGNSSGPLYMLYDRLYATSLPPKDCFHSENYENILLVEVMWYTPFHFNDK